MPVVVEKIDQPGSQDLADLEKIYLDYPAALRFAELQELLAANPDLALYGARFNARILGALTLKKTGSGFQIDHLCVRKITRRRNVARELLRQVLTACGPGNYGFNSCIEDAAVTALFTGAGFQEQANQFRHTG